MCLTCLAGHGEMPTSATACFQPGPKLFLESGICVQQCTFNQAQSTQLMRLFAFAAILRMVETLILGLQFHGSRQVPRHGKIEKRIWWIHIGIDMIDIGLMVTVLCVTFVNFWNAKPELTLSVKPGERRSARWSPTSFGDFLSFLRKYQHVSSCSSFCLNSRWSSEEETDDMTNSPIHPGLDFQPWFTMRKLRRWRELRLLSLQLLECFRLQGSSL